MTSVYRKLIMMHEEEVLQHIMSRVSFLLDKEDPYAELSKLIVLEYSLNPELISSEYNEVLDKVISKLVSFYNDTALFKLWNDYKYLQSMSNAA